MCVCVRQWVLYTTLPVANARVVQNPRLLYRPESPGGARVPGERRVNVNITLLKGCLNIYAFSDVHRFAQYRQTHTHMQVGSKLCMCIEYFDKTLLQTKKHILGPTTSISLALWGIRVKGENPLIRSRDHSMPSGLFSQVAIRLTG